MTAPTVIAKRRTNRSASAVSKPGPSPPSASQPRSGTSGWNALTETTDGPIPSVRLEGVQPGAAHHRGQTPGHYPSNSLALRSKSIEIAHRFPICGSRLRDNPCHLDAAVTRMQPMVAKGVRADGGASGMGQHSGAWWIRCLAVASLVLVAVAIAFEICRMGRLIAAWPAETAAILMLGLAGIAALASHKAIITLAARLEMLRWALDSAPEAQMIVAADGRIHYANRAFRELFPSPNESPLERVRQVLGSDAESHARFRLLH